jgi:hypothetical protein
MDQKLMCLVQLHSIFVLLNVPDGIFFSKIEKQWW